MWKAVLRLSQPQQPAEYVDIDANVPKGIQLNPAGVAVIIGNKTYTHRDVPPVEYALTDAQTVKKYLINRLGFLEKNIIFIENASKSEFELTFGTRDVPQGKLYNWVKPNASDVFVYYTGHGAPDLANKKAYFMPADGDPNYVRISGYPLDLFYENLSKIQAKSVTVVLDACFSGGSQVGLLLKDASPMYIDVQMPLIGNQCNLLTSSSGDQISSWYPESKHSLFTYYFLRGMRGEADSDRDRRITLREINEYVKENVPYMARRLYGREQIPVVKGNMETVICTY